MNNLPAEQAQVSGQAARIPAQPVTLNEGVSMLKAQGGTIRAEVQVIRKATGKIENYTLLMGDEAKEN